MTRQRRHHATTLRLAGLLLVATAREGVAQQPSAPDTIIVDAPAEGAPDLLSRHARSRLGAAVGATIALVPLDRPIQSLLQNGGLHRSAGLRKAAAWIAYAGGQGPFVAGAGSFVVGRVVGSERLADLGLHLTEAAALSSGISALGKGIAGRELPDVVGSHSPGSFSFGRGFHAKSGHFVSFPAGHATVSFASAAVITSEAERWHPELRVPVAVTTYGFATLVALTRMYQNKHWASDNPIAALIGTSTGLAVVRRQHGGPRSLVDRWLLGVTAVPTNNGVAVVWSPDLLGSRGTTD
jgi:membrane-associated phospholipid phosphatase